MARRGLKNPQLFWLTALIPLFGPLIYLCLRPPLQRGEGRGVRGEGEQTELVT